MAEDEERFTAVSGAGAEPEPKCDQEVWLRVASDVLVADLAVDTPEAGSVLGQPEKVVQWEKGCLSFANGADKEKKIVADLSIKIAPASQRRHMQLAKLRISIVVGEEKLGLQVFASNTDKFGRSKTFTGPAVGASVTHSARVGHRRVEFHVDWPETRRAVLTLVDCGQVPSVIGYRAKGLKDAQLSHLAAVNTPVKLLPLHRAPDPNEKDNDGQGLPTESWSIRPPLPPGMELTSDGRIEGRPTACQLPRVYEVTASNSAGIEKVKLALEVVLTDKERRRIMAMCRRELTHPEVDLPTVKPGVRNTGHVYTLDEATSRAMHGVCAREIERVVSHIPQEMIAMKDELVTMAPKCALQAQKVGSRITFARRQQYMIPRDFDTIQDCIDACPKGVSGGAHIWLLPGQYDGPVYIDRPVFIEATAPGAEILSAGDPVVHFVAGGEHAVVRNVALVRSVLQGRAPPGEAVRVSAGRPTIEQCRISAEKGTGVVLEGKTDALVTECVLFPPFDRIDGAGVVALHDAKGRVVNNMFSGDGVDVLAAATATLSCSENRTDPVYNAEATEVYHLATADDGSKFCATVEGHAEDAFSLGWSTMDEKPIGGDVLDAGLFKATQGKSWPKAASAPQLVKPHHIADGPFNWHREVTAWNPMTTYTDETLRDKHIRQTDLSWNRGPVLKPIMKGKEKKKRPPRLAKPDVHTHGSPTYQITEPLSPLSTTSPSVLSPTSPSRSKHLRSMSSSSLSPKGTRQHTERDKPSIHPSVWDHKVVWKRAPAVRMPQRAPGPLTLKMPTFNPVEKPKSSGYGIGGHGGAIQHVPIY